MLPTFPLLFYCENNYVKPLQNGKQTRTNKNRLHDLTHSLLFILIATVYHTYSLNPSRFQCHWFKIGKNMVSCAIVENQTLKPRCCSHSKLHLPWDHPFLYVPSGNQMWQLNPYNHKSSLKTNKKKQTSSCLKWFDHCKPTKSRFSRIFPRFFFHMTSGSNIYKPEAVPCAVLVVLRSRGQWHRWSLLRRRSRLQWHLNGARATAHGKVQVVRPLQGGAP